MSKKQKTLYTSIKQNNPYFEDYITRSTHSSNAIEGNTLSYYETYVILFDSKQPGKFNVSAREFYEAINHKYALNYALENVLSLNTIKHMCVLINKNINEISGFREERVFIRGTTYIPPEPVYVVNQLNQLLYEYSSSCEDLFYRIAKFHIDYERIHPFIDGNGRTGRIILNSELIAKGYAPAVITTQLKSEYFNSIADYNVVGLATMLSKLSAEEAARMSTFGIKVKV